METEKIALAFAKTKGFISVDFQENWNGYDVFIGQSSADEILIIGYPFFILVKNGVARDNKPEELFELMKFSNVPLSYTEKLM